MDYAAKHDVDHDGVKYRPGERVRFTDDQRALFVEHQLGPIAELLASAAIGPHMVVADADGDELERLIGIATTLGIALPDAPSLEDVEKAIAKARERLAVPAAPAIVRTAEGVASAPAPATSLPVLEASLGIERLREIGAAEGVTFVEGVDRLGALDAIEAKRGLPAFATLPELRPNLSLVDARRYAELERVTIPADASRADVIAALRLSRDARTAARG